MTEKCDYIIKKTHFYKKINYTNKISHWNKSCKYTLINCQNYIDNNHMLIGNVIILNLSTKIIVKQIIFYKIT